MRKTPFADDCQNGFVLPDTNSYTYACKRKTEMVLRGRVEAAFCKQLVFITLTYDRSHVPTNLRQLIKMNILQFFIQVATNNATDF